MVVSAQMKRGSLTFECAPFWEQSIRLFVLGGDLREMDFLGATTDVKLIRQSGTPFSQRRSLNS
jgi:hypothetical protein